MLAKDKIFREYDLRGVAGEDFDADLAYALGFAVARDIAERRAAETASPPVIAVGNDCRQSAQVMTDALIEGIRCAGVNVLYGGMGPTPQLYYLVYSRELAGGVMVTASHNPPDQNGFKITAGKNPVAGKEIQELKRRIYEYRDHGFPPPAGERGKLESIDARALYLSDLVARSKPRMGPRKIKVVVDGGNGVGGLVGPDLLRALGCEVIELYTNPDGRFPNHDPDPTVVENLAALRARVIAERADLGIGWDGDADRIGVVDERGEPVFADMLLVILGRQLLTEVKKPIILGDVKCSEHMFRDLEARGAQTVMWKTGHSLIKLKMRELQADLGGEIAGHLYFGYRYFGFDDALHGSARLVEILSHAAGPLKSLLEGLPRSYVTPEIRVPVPEEYKHLIGERAKQAFPEYETSGLDGARVKFSKGWGLVRASNTQPILILRFEAESEESLREYRALFEERISRLIAECVPAPMR